MNAVIAGMGLVTPLGSCVEETWDALLAGKYIEDHSRAAGERNGLGPRVMQMARAAANEAMRSAGWKDFDAVVVGTSKGSVESWLAGELEATGLADIATALSAYSQIQLTLSGACASGLMALIRAAMLIENGEARRMLVVASEASVHPLFIASFSRLGVLPKPGVGCRPFDQNRDGFLMSEAAAAVCLESSSMPGQVAIDRYALAGDAIHLTASDPTGASLRRLLTHVIDNRPVDLIHAHATATPLNDPIELSAIQSTLPAPFCGRAASAALFPKPIIYSHKASLGHSLGASGLISVVINALAHRHATIPGNVRTTDPLPTTNVQIPQHTTHRPVSRSLVLASGFGGASAAVSLKTT